MELGDAATIIATPIATPPPHPTAATIATTIGTITDMATPPAPSHESDPPPAGGIAGIIAGP